MAIVAPRRRILLVDASRDEREMYAEWFRGTGYCTLQAKTADDAFRLAAELAPDVVVLDVALPGAEDGVALTRRLKASDTTRAVPVVVLTARVFPRDRCAAESAGCDLFVAKPCTPARLAEAIRPLVV
jgi:two-component system phosphate regulon response regulator PhoB